MINDELSGIWKILPTQVQNDSCLSQFRMEHSLMLAHSDDGVETNGLLNTSAIKTADSAPNRTGIKLGTVVCIILFIVWLVSTSMLLTVQEKIIRHQLIAVGADRSSEISFISDQINGQRFGVILEGPFTRQRDNYNEFLCLTMVHNNSSYDVWELPLHPDRSSQFKRRHIFNIDQNSTNLIVSTNSSSPIAVQISYDPSPVNTEWGTLYAGCILIGLNVLIISEVIHRSLAALLAAFFSIGTLAALDDRPTMADIIGWLDFETLLLIFSMMILVNILMDTGVFDYIAVCIFKYSKGKSWPLVSTICVFTVIISTVLDNVTTILLMTPIVVRLCECLHLNPVPIFPIIILHANIAGLSTLIGHPPNLLITGNPVVSASGVTFLTYTTHMIIGVVIALIQTHIQIRLHYGDISQKLSVHTNRPLVAFAVLSTELAIWEKACADLPVTHSREGQLLHSLMQAKLLDIKGDVLKQSELEDNIDELYLAQEIFDETLKRLKREYPIKDRKLLIKSSAVFILVVLLFFIESVPQIQRLSLGWCSFIGVLLLLIVSNQNLDDLLQRVEWTILVFFASMFITMECLARLGLITFIMRQTEVLILCVENRSAQLTVAIIIVLWVSALTSSVVDSVPVTAMMIKIVVALKHNELLKLPIEPLVWALAYGPTLGGNGTLYGASSNIVCAGVAEKLGHKITFVQYFRVAFPIMIVNVLLITSYLLVAHVLFQWHHV